MTDQTRTQRWLTATLVLFVWMVGHACHAGEEWAVTHYRPTAGWVGDVHPFRHQGTWYIPYLAVPDAPLRQGLFGIHTRMVSSSDLVKWREVSVAMPEEPKRDWWLIANIEHEGVFYAFYNDNDGISLATSTDLHEWKPHNGNPVIRYEDAFASAGIVELRDPAVFRDDRTGEFMLIFAARRTHAVNDRYSGLFCYATSSDLVNWGDVAPLYDPGNINIPECPDMFALDGRYYLIGSWGTDRTGVGHYRMSSHPKGPWRRGRTEILGGSDLVAPTTAGDADRRLLFGWIPTCAGGRDYGASEWAGHLAYPRELYAGRDGSLHTRPPAELVALRAGRLVSGAAARDSEVIGTWAVVDGGFMSPPGTDYAEALLPGDYSRFEIVCTLTLSADCPNAGVVFRAGDPRFPGYEVSVDRAHQQLVLREHLERRRRLAFQTIDIRPDEPMQLRVFVDGSVVEAFLDNRFSLTGRAYRFPPGRRVGFYKDGGGCQVTDIALYGLREVYPEPNQTASLILRPMPDPARRDGGSVLFPVTGANVYASHHPALNVAGSLTLECWIKCPSGITSLKRNLIVKGDGREHGYHYGLNLTRENGLEFYFKSSDGFVGLASEPGSVVASGEWMHLAGVLDTEADEIRLYRNGERIATRSGVTQVIDPTNEGALRLGNAAGCPGSNPYHGLMDEVRVWNVARTDKQIAAAYDHPLALGDRDGLVVYWDFDTPVVTEGDRRVSYRNNVRNLPDLQARLFDGAEPFGENFMLDRGVPSSGR